MFGTRKTVCLKSAEGTEVKHFVCIDSWDESVCVDSWDESVCIDSWDELMVHFVRRKDVVLSLLWDNRRWLGACFFLSNLWDKFRCD